MNHPSIFSYDNAAARFLVKLVKLLWLNILWAAASFPLITAGASACALYYTAMRLARDEEGYLTADFFTAFRSSFKKGTFFFFLTAFVIMVCSADFAYFGSRNLWQLKLLAFPAAGFLFAFSFAAVYLLPLTAQFENTIAGTFHAAVGIAVQNPHWSFCLVILNLLLPLLILFRFLPLAVLGPALPVFLQSYLLNRLLKKYLPAF